MKRIVKTIPKSKSEEVRVGLDEFETNGRVYDMVSARIFFEDGGGGFRPGKNGINVKVELLPALVDGLTEALRIAREAGLVGADDLKA